VSAVVAFLGGIVVGFGLAVLVMQHSGRQL
jgi:hypothetical protein